MFIVNYNNKEDTYVIVLLIEAVYYMYLFFMCPLK